MPLTNTPMYLTQCYERYGGMMQGCPLTADEQKYDDTCREMDRIEGLIGEKSLGLFTAYEYMWFHRFVTKMWIGLKQDQLDRQLSELRDLLARLETREPR